MAVTLAGAGSPAAAQDVGPAWHPASHTHLRLSSGEMPIDERPISTHDWLIKDVE